jgi:hypothetical protein
MTPFSWIDSLSSLRPAVMALSIFFRERLPVCFALCHVPFSSYNCSKIARNPGSVIDPTSDTVCSVYRCFGTVNVSPLVTTYDLSWRSLSCPPSEDSCLASHYLRFTAHPFLSHCCIDRLDNFTQLPLSKTPQQFYTGEAILEIYRRFPVISGRQLWLGGSRRIWRGGV